MVDALVGFGLRRHWPIIDRTRSGLIAASEDDPDMRSRLAGFRQGLERLGYGFAKVQPSWPTREPASRPRSPR
jgi:hypothetical protein